MSWIVPVVGLVYAVTLAENRFPVTVPGESRGAYWLVGISGAILFFLSLLAHEVGHAVVARREGIGVHGISLWLLGGVAKLEHEAGTPGAELRIAAVGPVTSAGVGLVFLLLHNAISGGLQGPGLIAIFAELFSWLAFINLLLAGFNLLPGAPLDGGRVFSALVWMGTHDQTRAQAIGARVGQALGAALIAGGAYLGFSLGNPNGIWALIVGAYILASASSELRATAAMGVLRDVTVAEVMDADPPVLPDWMTVHDLAATAARYQPHTAFVVHGMDGRVTGLLTAEAVQASDPRSWPALRLSDLAFPLSRVQTAGLHDSVLVTAQRAHTGGSGRALVLAPDGRIAGVVGDDLTARALAITQTRPAAVAPSPSSPPPPPPPVTSPAPTSPGLAGTSLPAGPPTSWPGRGVGE